MDIVAGLENIRPLMQDERVQAMQYAKNALRASFGDAPNREQVVKMHTGKHPKSFRHAVTILCIIALLAAFSLSAMHLYFIGSETFGASIPDARGMVVAGIAIVLLAEATQLISTIALAATQHRTTQLIFNATAIGATLIAIVGNAQVSLPGHWTNPFAWLLAFFPPLFVIGIATALKQQWLQSLEESYAANLQYEDQLTVWQQRVNADLLQHPDWMRFYGNALFDQIKRANQRNANAKAVLIEASADGKRWLVQREIDADNWFMPIAQVAASEQMQVQVRKEPTRRIAASRTMQITAPGKAIVRRTASTTGQTTNEVLDAMQNALVGADGLLHVACPYCKQDTSNATEKGLRLALTAHVGRYCKMKPAQT